MSIKIREFEADDVIQMIGIWNSVVDDAVAFPQTNRLDPTSGAEFFASQTFTGVAYDEKGDICGLYILHPNNVGRCSHICNCSYAVHKEKRGMGTGELLVRHSIKKGHERGFRILQFNAVVATNTAALTLYKKLGFTQLGTIPGGFLLKDGSYADIIPHYISLTGE